MKIIIELPEDLERRLQSYLNTLSPWALEAVAVVGEHYAEQNQLGKGAIAFFEGVMEEPK